MKILDWSSPIYHNKNFMRGRNMFPTIRSLGFPTELYFHDNVFCTTKEIKIRSSAKSGPDTALLLSGRMFEPRHNIRTFVRIFESVYCVVARTFGVNVIGRYPDQ